MDRVWVILYEDGSHHFAVSSEQWARLPDDRVLCVLEYEEEECRGRFVGYDYYLLRDSTMIGCFSDGLWQHLRDGIPKGAIKFGKWVTNEQWRKVWSKHFPGEPVPEGYNPKRELVPAGP